MCDVKISVIVPVYNAEHTLNRCVNSICSQDMKEIEVICVDDHSSDDSLPLLKEMAEADERIIVLHNEKNEGTLIARKRGVKAAQGEYIMFADNDDWYDPDCFSELYKTAKEKQTDILMYGFRPVKITHDGDDEIIEEQAIWFAVPKEEMFRGDNCLTIDNRINLLWNKIIKAEICKEAYAHTEDIFLTIAEDTYACMLIHYFAKSFAAITDVYYNWDCSDGVSNSDEISLERFFNACECMDRYEKAYSAFLSERNERQLLEDFNNRETEVGYDFCIDLWRRTVPNEDADQINRVIDVYGEKKVFSHLHRRMNILEENRRDMGAEIDRLYEVEKYLHTIIDSLESEIEKKNDRIKALKDRIKVLKEEVKLEKQKLDDIKNSTSFKVGKAVTVVPRKIKKGFKE